MARESSYNRSAVSMCNLIMYIRLHTYTQQNTSHTTDISELCENIEIERKGGSGSYRIRLVWNKFSFEY